MKTALAVLVFITSILSGTAAESPVNAAVVAADVQLHLPPGWNCQLTAEKGQMGIPYGLKEPLFQIDFVNTNEVLHIMNHRPEWLKNWYEEVQRVGNEAREKGETNELKITALQMKAQQVKDTNEVEVATIHPNFRLYFYGKENRKEMLNIIKREQVYSFNIPDLFGETRDFVIVSAAGESNRFVTKEGWGGGDGSPEGQQMLAPLLQSLEKYVAAHQ